jgi:apolipoprotein N-acyltransferase
MQEGVRRIGVQKRLILLSISAIVVAISMPGMVSSIFVWFGLVPLFFALKNTSVWRSLFFGWYFGIIYIAISMYWLLPTLIKNIALFNGFPEFLGVLAFVMLIIIEGFFFGIFGFFYTFFENRNERVPSILHVLSVAGIYTLVEFLRGYGALGFTGSRLSDALYRQIGTIQLTSFIGTLGLTFLIFIVNYLIYSFFMERKFKSLTVVASIVAGSYIFSFIFPYFISPNSGKALTIGAVQPNVTVSQRYLMNQNEIFKDVEWGIKDLNGKTHIIFFPEGTFESEISNTNVYFNLVDLLKKDDMRAIIGYPSVKDGKIYNSAGFFDGNGIEGIYSKHILVPFTETLPYPQIFGAFGFLKLAQFFTPGKNFTIFSFEGTKFSTQICFESYFGWLSRKFTDDGAQFLVVITDDSWFDQRTALVQHFAQSVMRAVENRKWMVQVADTGITGIINPYGVIVDEFPVHQRIASTFDLYPNDTITFYDRFGDLVLWISIGLIAFESVILIFKK